MTTKNIFAADAGKPVRVDVLFDPGQPLDRVLAFCRRFVAYPSQHAAIAHVLWIAHAHAMEAWDSTPRLAFLSPEPGSGKTRALEVTELLVPRPVEAVNVTPAYLFRKVGDEAGMPTILFDEIDTVFGPKAKDNEEIRGMLNAGHRRGAKAGRCVVRGKNIETEEIEAYCAIALAGIGNLPDTVLSRSVVVAMKRRAADEQVEPFRRRKLTEEAEWLRADLEAFGAQNVEHLCEAWPDMPDSIKDRDADVWEPLIAIADAAGGEWPERARVAAVALVADTKREAPSLGLRLLADLRAIFEGHEQLPTELILNELNSLDEAPWNDLRGKPLDPRRLANLLSKYEIKSQTIRTATGTPKGYRSEDLHDAWQRYLGPSHITAATSATAATAEEIPGW